MLALPLRCTTVRPLVGQVAAHTRVRAQEDAGQHFSTVGADLAGRGRELALVRGGAGAVTGAAGAHIHEQLRSTQETAPDWAAAGVSGAGRAPAEHGPETDYFAGGHAGQAPLVPEERLHTRMPTQASHAGGPAWDPGPGSHYSVLDSGRAASQEPDPGQGREASSGCSEYALDEEDCWSQLGLPAPPEPHGGAEAGTSAAPGVARSSASASGESAGQASAAPGPAGGAWTPRGAAPASMDEAWEDSAGSGGGGHPAAPCRAHGSGDAMDADDEDAPQRGGAGLRAGGGARGGSRSSGCGPSMRGGSRGTGHAGRSARAALSAEDMALGGSDGLHTASLASSSVSSGEGLPDRHRACMPSAELERFSTASPSASGAAHLSGAPPQAPRTTGSRRSSGRAAAGAAPGWAPAPGPAAGWARDPDPRQALTDMYESLMAGLEAAPPAERRSGGARRSLGGRGPQQPAQPQSRAGPGGDGARSTDGSGAWQRPADGFGGDAAAALGLHDADAGGGGGVPAAGMQGSYDQGSGEGQVRALGGPQALLRTASVREARSRPPSAAPLARRSSAHPRAAPSEPLAASRARSSAADLRTAPWTPSQNEATPAAAAPAAAEQAGPSGNVLDAAAPVSDPAHAPWVAASDESPPDDPHSVDYAEWTDAEQQHPDPGLAPSRSAEHTLTRPAARAHRALGRSASAVGREAPHETPSGGRRASAAPSSAPWRAPARAPRTHASIDEGAPMGYPAQGPWDIAEEQDFEPAMFEPSSAEVRAPKGSAPESADARHAARARGTLARSASLLTGSERPRPAAPMSRRMTAVPGSALLQDSMRALPVSAGAALLVDGKLPTERAWGASTEHVQPALHAPGAAGGAASVPQGFRHESAGASVPRAADPAGSAPWPPGDDWYESSEGNTDVHGAPPGDEAACEQEAGQHERGVQGSSAARASVHTDMHRSGAAAGRASAPDSARSADAAVEPADARAARRGSPPVAPPAGSDSGSEERRFDGTQVPQQQRGAGSGGSDAQAASPPHARACASSAAQSARAQRAATRGRRASASPGAPPWEARAHAAAQGPGPAATPDPLGSSGDEWAVRAREQAGAAWHCGPSADEAAGHRLRHEASGDNDAVYERDDATSVRACSSAHAVDWPAAADAWDGVALGPARRPPARELSTAGASGRGQPDACDAWDPPGERPLGWRSSEGCASGGGADADGGRVSGGGSAPRGAARGSASEAEAEQSPAVSAEASPARSSAGAASGRSAARELQGADERALARPTEQLPDAGGADEDGGRLRPGASWAAPAGEGAPAARLARTQSLLPGLRARPHSAAPLRRRASVDPHAPAWRAEAARPAQVREQGAAGPLRAWEAGGEAAVQAWGGSAAAASAAQAQACQDAGAQPRPRAPEEPGVHDARAGASGACASRADELSASSPGEHADAGSAEGVGVPSLRVAVLSASGARMAARPEAPVPGAHAAARPQARVGLQVRLQGRMAATVMLGPLLVTRMLFSLFVAATPAGLQQWRGSGGGSPSRKQVTTCTAPPRLRLRARPYAGIPPAISRGPLHVPASKRAHAPTGPWTCRPLPRSRTSLNERAGRYLEHSPTGPAPGAGGSRPSAALRSRPHTAAPGPAHRRPAPAHFPGLDPADAARRSAEPASAGARPAPGAAPEPPAGAQEPRAGAAEAQRRAALGRPEPPHPRVRHSSAPPLRPSGAAPSAGDRAKPAGRGAHAAPLATAAAVRAERLARAVAAQVMPLAHPPCCTLSCEHEMPSLPPALYCISAGTLFVRSPHSLSMNTYTH